MVASPGEYICTLPLHAVSLDTTICSSSPIVLPLEGSGATGVNILVNLW
jgi:hypothetical protein